MTTAPEHNAKKLALLFELSRAFSALVDLDELLRLINAKTKEVFDAENSAIMLLDEAKHELYFPMSSDASPAVEKRFETIRFPADKGIAGWVLKTGKGTSVPDVTEDPRFYPEVDKQSGARTRDLLYAPLRTRRGILGLIGLRNKRHGAFSEEDLSFLETLAGSIAIAIENARLYTQVRDSEQRLQTQVGVLRRDLARLDRFTEIVGTGSAMGEIFRLMESAAASTISVLIEGETGTGKELVARAIHRESARATGPFLGINCAAVPETLLESELFGHSRGAFTGAAQDKRGLFEAATGGTIFLDEIGEMPALMQAKLLRVLQEEEVTPLGDTRPHRIDVRVMSATNRELAAEIKTGGFRQDLYYRLAAFPIRLPPLRERSEDVPLLAGRHVAEASKRHAKRISGIDPEAVELLVGFEWPGNVRELENEIERAVALARDGESIRPEHLSQKLRAEPTRDASSSGIAQAVLAANPQAPSKTSLRRGTASFEARYIAEVLRQNAGNVTRAAKAMGMSRVTLYKKMKDYGLR